MNGNEDDALLAQALEEMRQILRQQGDPTEVLRRYPDQAGELAVLVETLRQLETARVQWTWLSAQTQMWEASPDSRIPLPERVGRYRIVAHLGEGGMGTVYQAIDPELQRTVAIKMPHLPGGGDRAAILERFLREGRAAARVLHPNICPVHDVGIDQGRPYLVLAHVPGESLAQRLCRGRLEDQAAVTLARQIASALAALHERGIIHRDLKPGNVLLDENGRALLTDFGLARPEEEAALTATGAILGTPSYMAPEQAGGPGEVGPRTDLYSLGVLLYELLTGKLPFEGSPLAVISRLRSDDPPRPSSWRRDLDPTLEAIILRAMARHPADRYPDAGALEQDLEAWQAGRPVAVAQPPTMTKPTTLRIHLPDGTPVGLTVDTPGTAKDMTVSLEERPAGKRRGRRLRLVVSITLGLVLLLISLPLLQQAQNRIGDKSGPAQPVPDKEHVAATQRRLSIARALAQSAPDYTPDGARQLTRPPIHHSVEAGARLTRRSLPLVIGVLANLAGQPKTPLLPLDQRRWIAIDRNNFPDVLQRIGPRFTASIPDVPGNPPVAVDLAFARWTDFAPAAMVARLPAALRHDAYRTVLTHPDLLSLESAWRGLHDLVFRIDPASGVKVRVLPIRPEELRGDARKGGKALLRQLSADLRHPGGEPFSLLVTDLVFTWQGDDLEVLRSLAATAQSVAAPLVAAAHFNEESIQKWKERPDDPHLQGLELPAPWTAFRATDAARFIALTVPRLRHAFEIARVGTTTVLDFRYLSGAWLFAAQVADAQARFGWPARLSQLEGAPGLPAMPHGDPGPPPGHFHFRSLAINLNPGQEMMLSEAGFLPVVSPPVKGKERPQVAFVEARSCHSDPEAARLSMLLCSCRFVHHLVVQARDRLAMGIPAGDVEAGLQRWLDGYVLAQPAQATPRERAERPLLEGRVRLREEKDPPGRHEVECSLRPGYQLHPIPNKPLRLILPVFTGP